MTTESWIQIGVTVIGWVALVATMNVRIKDHGTRITNLETKHDKLATDFVPRPEVAAQLTSLKDSVVRIEALLNAVLYATGSKASVQVNQPR